MCHKINSNLFPDDWAVLLIPWCWHQQVYSGYNDPSNSKSWKVLETVFSHLKFGVGENIEKSTTRYSLIDQQNMSEHIVLKTSKWGSVFYSFN